MRARTVAILRGPAREDAGPRCAAVAGLGDTVVAKKNAPVAAQVFELTGHELKLGAHAAS